jgi:uncharacterized protein YbgA (DUF1722 family)
MSDTVNNENQEVQEEDKLLLAIRNSNQNHDEAYGYLMESIKDLLNKNSTKFDVTNPETIKELDRLYGGDLAYQLLKDHSEHLPEVYRLVDLTMKTRDLTNAHLIVWSELIKELNSNQRDELATQTKEFRSSVLSMSKGISDGFSKSATTITNQLVGKLEGEVVGVNKAINEAEKVRSQLFEESSSSQGKLDAQRAELVRDLLKELKTGFTSMGAVFLEEHRNASNKINEKELKRWEQIVHKQKQMHLYLGMGFATFFITTGFLLSKFFH